MPNYAPDTHERASVAVDLAVPTVLDADLKVFLVKRSTHPFKNLWALPGDFVRSAGERVSVRISPQPLAAASWRPRAYPPGVSRVVQLQTFGRSGRDPRGRTISVAWTTLIPPDRAALIASDSSTGWFSCAEEAPWMRLAFDHADILQAAIDRTRTDIEYTNLAFSPFHRPSRSVRAPEMHEAVKGAKHDARNFRRRFQRLVDDEKVEEAPDGVTWAEPGLQRCGDSSTACNKGCPCG